jgi:hypothetical protein
MRARLVAIVLLLVVVGLICRVPGCSARRVAENAREDCASLFSQQNFSEFGFRTFEESQAVRQASLEEPAHAYSIPPSRILTFERGQDPKSLLRDDATRFFPVSVNGEAKMGIEVERGFCGWEITACGGSALAQIVSRASREARAAGVEGVRVLLVDVPALDMLLLGRESGTQLELAPLQPVPNLTAAELRPAADVIAILRPLAMKRAQARVVR